MSQRRPALTCNLQHVEEAADEEGHKEDACTDPVHLQTHQKEFVCSQADRQHTAGLMMVS